jgi:hypothetical protein
MRNESKLQSDILSDLRSYGKHCECFKIEKASDNGVPDIFFSTTITGPVFIETKRLKGKAQKLQTVKIDRLRECGVKAFFCYSWNQWVNIKSIIGLFRTMLL